MIFLNVHVPTDSVCVGTLIFGLSSNGAKEKENQHKHCFYIWRKILVKPKNSTWKDSLDKHSN